MRWKGGGRRCLLADSLNSFQAQSEEEAVAEDEAAFENSKKTTMEVPLELVPAVRELLAKSQA